MSKRKATTSSSSSSSKKTSKIIPHSPAISFKCRPDLLATYPPSHWAKQIMPVEDAKFVAVLEVTDSIGQKHQVLVLVRSAEGYAIVVAMTDRQDMSRILNRAPIKREYEVIMLAATQVAGAYLTLGLIPSMELLGNNSHGIGPEGGLELGNKTEPSSLHVHLIGRGDPKRCYISNVPLRGAPPGDVMIPRQREEHFENEDERREVSNRFANILDEIVLHPNVRIKEQRVDESRRKEAVQNKSEMGSEDKTIHIAHIGHHNSLRRYMADRHQKEANELETKCKQELANPEDCNFVKSMRSEMAKEAMAGKCFVCKTATGIEACKWCEMCQCENPSMKCKECSWTDGGGMGCINGSHGFCAECVERVKEERDACDIPQRNNPEHPMLERGPVERDHLHPFHMCDCGICAWCGEECYDCCSDHVGQHCSCYPEV